MKLRYLLFLFFITTMPSYSFDTIKTWFKEQLNPLYTDIQNNTIVCMPCCPSFCIRSHQDKNTYITSLLEWNYNSLSYDTIDFFCRTKNYADYIVTSILQTPYHTLLDDECLVLKKLKKSKNHRLCDQEIDIIQALIHVQGTTTNTQECIIACLQSLYNYNAIFTPLILLHVQKQESFDPILLSVWFTESLLRILNSHNLFTTISIDNPYACYKKMLNHSPTTNELALCKELIKRAHNNQENLSPFFESAQQKNSIELIVYLLDLAQTHLEPSLIVSLMNNPAYQEQLDTRIKQFSQQQRNNLLLQACKVQNVKSIYSLYLKYHAYLEDNQKIDAINSMTPSIKIFYALSLIGGYPLSVQTYSRINTPFVFFLSLEPTENTKLRHAEKNLTKSYLFYTFCIACNKKEPVSPELFTLFSQHQKIIYLRSRIIQNNYQALALLWHIIKQEFDSCTLNTSLFAEPYIPCTHYSTYTSALSLLPSHEYTALYAELKRRSASHQPILGYKKLIQYMNKLYKNQKKNHLCDIQIETISSYQ